MTALPRVQLALSVSDVDAAVEFYSRLFDAKPHKRRPGYANFALDAPPLKLVLIEDADGAGGLNHLGVEVSSADEVEASQKRATASGLTTSSEDDVVCCYARQQKVWVTDPDGASWEVYTILDDDPSVAAEGATEEACSDAACCA
jgi:catechol 2,3-dioxygenase-like lactoylglutathione lyase family enzyme